MVCPALTRCVVQAGSSDAVVNVFFRGLDVRL